MWYRFYRFNVTLSLIQWGSYLGICEIEFYEKTGELAVGDPVITGSSLGIPNLIASILYISPSVKFVFLKLFSPDEKTSFSDLLDLQSFTPAINLSGLPPPRMTIAFALATSFSFILLNGYSAIINKLSDVNPKLEKNNKIQPK